MKKEKLNKALCIGEILWDMLPTGAKAGGAPMNVALHLHNIGLDTTFVGRIGDDNDGQKLSHFLSEFGLSTKFLQVDPELETSKVLVNLDDASNASYEICSDVAWDNIELTPSLLKQGEQSDIIVYGSLASRSENSANTIKDLLDSSKKALKVMDINLRPPFDTKETIEPLLLRADIAKMNSDEIKIVASWYGYHGEDEREMIIWFSETFSCPTICITKGEDGATLYSEGKFYDHKGFKIVAVDSVGAGDAFLAGLISSMAKENTPSEAITFACATGAFVASKEGATPTYDLDEIKDIINKK